METARNTTVDGEQSVGIRAAQQGPVGFFHTRTGNRGAGLIDDRQREGDRPLRT
jgi:hypothetical protein